MQFDIDITSEVPADKWQELLDMSANITPFHLQNWVTASALTYGFKPLYLIARTQNGTILAGMPILQAHSHKGMLHGYHSLLGGSYGAVIIREDTDHDISKKILTHFVDLLKRWNVTKAIVVDFNNTSSFLSKCGFNTRVVFTHILDLSQTLENIRNNFDYSIRKNIEKAKRNSLVVHTIEGPDELELYYSITNAVARKYNREPYPHELFLNIYKLMVEKGEAKFSLTFRGEQPLSGALHLIAKGHIFNWLMPAYPEYMEYRPNEALISSIIDWASEHNFKIYNFGGSPVDATGLIHFKEKWGTKRKEYNIYELESSSLIVKSIKYLQNLK
jgi:hypothetical protein